jgi:hypothetical protein
VALRIKFRFSCDRRLTGHQQGEGNIQKSG